MLTDAPPRKANRAGFLESDGIKTLDLPQDGRLPSITNSIEAAMKAGKSTGVRRTAAEFMDAASDEVHPPENTQALTASYASFGTLPHDYKKGLV